MPSHEQASKLAGRLDKLYEFERAPVTPDKLHDGRYFAGLFAGEHVAATEFVIGALFVQWGAGAADLIWGLVLGNFLAVLSWAFICAPIAVQTRLTLYWYVRRIIGPGLSVVYNFINALLYCCLAAAMLGVSASAAIIGLEAVTKGAITIQHPELNDIMPNSVGWVLVVLAVGAVVISLAIMGFKRLSQFASLCSPWMFLIFVAGALASLPGLRGAEQGGIRSLGDLWQVAESKIWTGQPYENPLRPVPADVLPVGGGESHIPDALRTVLGKPVKDSSGKTCPAVHLSSEAVLSSDPGTMRWKIRDGDAAYVIKPGTAAVQDGSQATLTLCSVLKKLGFWHIAFFAWFCNLAMHVGLSDMAIFRFARHWSYGFYSAFGMYLGHFVAWVCAGVMGAAAGRALDPGAMANLAAGVPGLLAVLLAGWTTANPTIYRAGLALQIVTPDWPRWKVTLVAGAVTTVVGFFPAIFMKLLDFVAIYGLMLMPIGAIIVAEHWLFPVVGLRRYWTDKTGRLINPAALVTWGVVLVLCFPIEDFTGGLVRSPMALMGVELFFRWLPGWFIAVGLYLALCKLRAGSWNTGVVAGEVDEFAGLRSPAAVVTAAAGSVRPAKPLPPLAWVAGALAIGSLAMCLVLPWRVFRAGTEGYAEHMAVYKTWLLFVTVLYFVGAIVWMYYRERSRPTS